MNTRFVFGVGIAAVTMAAGCGGGASSNVAKVGTAHDGTGSSDRVIAAGSSSTTATACQTKNLRLSLGQSQGTAGSVYEPLRFTNHGEGACTLYGYPGVSFVKAESGDQVGAPASRNAQHRAQTITLSPGSSAKAVLQIVDHDNYGPAQCRATAVSGLRVYPPGNKAAAYVPFDAPATACATDVTQLTVEAVAGSTP